MLEKNGQLPTDGEDKENEDAKREIKDSKKRKSMGGGEPVGKKKRSVSADTGDEDEDDEDED